MATFQYGTHSYFSQLSPLAEKISRDVCKAKADYSEEQWLTLTASEQENILNNCIIKPEIALRYASSSAQAYAYDRSSLRTFIHQNVGTKILHDEHSGDYRDEHSSPFSYRTKSQINLTVIVGNNNSADESKDSCSWPLRAKVAPAAPKSLPKSHLAVAFTTADSAPDPDSRHQLNRRAYDDTACFFTSDEKSNLLADFGSKHTLHSSSTELSDDEMIAKDLQQEESTKLLSAEMQIPKGFDFLSNW